ncbi:MAG: sigma-70 family RNA polymerase sigma factor [Chloroflexota bacterium]
MTAPIDDVQLVERLRKGDENAFAWLLEMYQSLMVRIALMYVREREVAEEVVQETWLGVLRGLDRFEGRSSLKTWIFSILTNSAKTRAQREGRSIPFLLLETDDAPDSDESTVEPERFSGETDHWAVHPDSWDDVPEALLLSQETQAVIHQAIQALAPNQRKVITLRDIEGWSSEEVCNVLEISETNQRVLLHRARAAVRGVLEQYLGGKNG